MEIFGRELNFRSPLSFSASAPDTSVTPKSAKTGIEIGDPGTRILGGIILEEYNPKLAGREGILVYDEMRRSDGTVKALLSACTLPIRAANWYVKPASEDADDIAIAEFVEECLFERSSVTFDDFLRQALLMLPFGVMAFEKVFTTADFDGNTRIIWDKLAPRMPKSIYKWAIDVPGAVVTSATGPNGANAGFNRGITQIRSDGSLAQIPLDKLIVFVNDMEGENWWGSSILRAPYKHWFIKNTFYKIDAIAFERQGLGVPYVKMPEGFTEKDRTAAEKILKNLRANSMAYIVEPNDYEIGFKDMMATTTRDPANSIQHHNREIMKAGLAQFIELGSSSGSGSRAVSQDHSELFLKSLEATATMIASTVNKYGIKQLVDLNFDTVDYPTLEYSGITETDVAALATTYGALITAGGIQAGTVDEQHFRELLGLPEREEDDIIEKPAAPQMVPELDKDGKPVLNPDGSPKMIAAPAAPVAKPKPGDTTKVEDAGDIEPDDKQAEEINDDLGLSVVDLKKKYPEAKEIATMLEASVSGLPVANALALTRGRIASVKVAETGKHAEYFKTVTRELHALQANLRRKAFAEENDFKGYRPLTFAEKKVDFKGIQKVIDELEGQMAGEMKALMNDALEEFMRRVTLATHKGDVEAVKQASLDIEKQLAKLIKQAATAAYTYGKANVSKEIGVKTPANSQAILDAIAIQADAIAKAQVSQIETDAKTALTTATSKGATTTAALAAAASTAEDTIAALGDDTANIMMAGYVNTGRNDVMANNGDDVYALQRSEILDQRTCNFCLSVDGRVIDKDDPFGQETIFHSGCRGIWVAILKDEEELPPIGNIPQAIRDRFGDVVNDLIQPKNPITKKDSPARKEAERRAGNE